jgi:hypothetical protein
MYYSESTLPVSIDDVCKMLDTAVDSRCLAYFEEFQSKPPLDIDDATGELVDKDKDEIDDALMELVFICDARANLAVDNSEYIDHNSWVEVAKQGIRRISRQVTAMRGFERMHLFRDDIRMQVEAYEDMRTRLEGPTGLRQHNSTGLDYAARVAMGEIRLEEDPANS